MIETRKKTIDGAEYAVTQFPGRAAFRLKSKLLMKFGPALAAALGGLDLKSTAADLKVGAIGDALSKLAIGDAEFMDIVMELLSSTRRDGKEITGELFDLEFAGNLGTVYKILGFVLEVNFGSFFGNGGIGGLVKRLTPTPPPEN